MSSCGERGRRALWTGGTAALGHAGDWLTTHIIGNKSNGGRGMSRPRNDCPRGAGRFTMQDRPTPARTEAQGPLVCRMTRRRKGSERPKRLFCYAGGRGRCHRLCPSPRWQRGSFSLVPPASHRGGVSHITPRLILSTTDSVHVNNRGWRCGPSSDGENSSRSAGKAKRHRWRLRRVLTCPITTCRADHCSTPHMGYRLR
jgi:hypothetical protein